MKFKAIIFAFTLFQSVVFAAQLPKLDLRNLPKNQSYNLYETGCFGVRFAIPTNHRVTTRAEGEAKCELSNLPELLDKGYGIELKTEIGEDAGECVVDLISSSNGKKVRSYSFSCNPT